MLAFVKFLEFNIGAFLSGFGGVLPLNVFTSAYAIIAYVVILVLIVVVLIISLIAKDSSAPTSVTLSSAVGSAGKIGAGGRGVAEGEGKRFYMLSRLDGERGRLLREEYDESIGLSELCERFRNFAAGSLGLYYEISDIRRFVAGLAVSRIIILQGISGTGKTSLGYAFGEFIDNPSAVIPVQPMWKERTDLIGYYNEFTKRFNETPLLEKLYEANYSKEMYVTVLDEMNIARIEYYFAEFLSLLELPNPEKRYLSVVSDEWESDPAQLVNGRVRLAPNMWFIGTANNDDSTFSISDKVYDRAMILNLDYKAEAFRAPRTERVHLRSERFMELARAAQEEYAVTKRNELRLAELDELLIKHFKLTFGNRIRKQIATYIPVYLACGGEELEALDDILSKKVIRKLETQNSVHLKNAAQSFVTDLETLFGKSKMPKSIAHLETILRNM